MAHIRIEGAQGKIPMRWQDFWAYRDLLYFFAWRDVRLRYRQTLLGFAWAIVQPSFLMLAFTLVFGRYAKIPSDGLPYPVFALTALLPWQLFSTVLGSCSKSLLNHQSIIKKVFFPRIFIPLSSVGVSVFDFFIVLPLLLFLMLHYRLPVTPALLSLPFFILLSVTLAAGIGLWISGLTVRYRDLYHVIPFLTQFLFFLTPIAYPLGMLPSETRWLFWLNPLSGIMEGMRWACGADITAPWGPVLCSLILSLFMFVSGLNYFQKIEGKLDEQL